MNLDYKNRVEINKLLRKSGNYFLIALISLVSLIFLPLLGSTVGFEFVIPDTFAGVMVWLSSRLAVAVVNVLIFYCFVQQAKVNVSDNEKYKEAMTKLNKLQKENKILPRSPEMFMKRQWRHKGFTLFLASVLSTVFLAESIIRFDLTQFLTYLFTLAIGLVWGYLTMRNNEEYWTNEFLLYVDMLLDGEYNKEVKKRKVKIGDMLFGYDEPAKSKGNDDDYTPDF